MEREAWTPEQVKKEFQDSIYSDLLAIAKEIADDSNCDLVNSERRIRLYAAINRAELNG